MGNAKISGLLNVNKLGANGSVIQFNRIYGSL